MCGRAAPWMATRPATCAKLQAQRLLLHDTLRHAIISAYTHVRPNADGRRQFWDRYMTLRMSWLLHDNLVTALEGTA